MKQSNPNYEQPQDTSSNQTAGIGPIVQDPIQPAAVSNCYVFKSQLQEYAQKVGLPTPVYETIREGPSHEPSFRSTVVVNGVRYDSLPGVFNRKAAEQSAAEVALMELSKCGEKKESINMPVHETGFCKNMLQEYAQKMNYAIPTYICKKEDSQSRTPLYSCMVEIGGIQYIGAAAKTKKEAEIKAARTALLAIQSSTRAASVNVGCKTQYTVVPRKRKVPPTTPPQLETVKHKKPKKSRFKKKAPGKRRPMDGVVDQIEAAKISASVGNDDMGTQAVTEQFQNGLSDAQLPHSGQISHAFPGQNNGGSSDINEHNGETRFAIQQFNHGLSDPCLLDREQNSLGFSDQVNGSSDISTHNGDTRAAVQEFSHDLSDSRLPDNVQNPHGFSGQDNGSSTINQRNGGSEVATQQFQPGPSDARSPDHQSNPQGSSGQDTGSSDMNTQ